MMLSWKILETKDTGKAIGSGSLGAHFGWDLNPILEMFHYVLSVSHPPVPHVPVVIMFSFIPSSE